MKVTVTIPIEAAEKMLREAAKAAALYGALVDHMTRKTSNRPGPQSFDEARKQWAREFLRAKKIVECFGLEYEPTSEAEALTVTYGTKPVKDRRGRQETVLGIFRRVEADYSQILPCYRREVHEHACDAAADRVVRRWREQIATGEKAA